MEQVAKAGVDWIQVREKDLSGRELTSLVEQAIACVGSGKTVLVNDRVDVAVVTGSSGLHLGEHSLPLSEAKKLVSQHLEGKRFLTGVSAHSLEGAVQAEQEGADYVIFGPVFATPSKAGFGQPQGLQSLRELCRRVRIPVLAIGGITLEKAGDCMAAGAAGIAAIRLFQDAAELDDLVKELQKVS
jgi:thiamine-phosphate pyrophosphorylase